MLRITYQELFDALLRMLLKLEFEPERARLCAQLFADTSRDGVYSHGLNRFPRFVSMIPNGYVDVQRTTRAASCFGTAGALGRTNRSGQFERPGSSVNPGSGAWRFADQIIEHFQLPPHSTGERVRYSGERVLATRKDNLANGVPVEPSIWKQLDSL